MKKLFKLIIGIILILIIFKLYLTHIHTVGSGTIPVITYHSVQDIDEKNTYIIPIDTFEETIKGLCEENFHFLSIEEIVNAIDNNESLPNNSVLITFDDGYEDNYTNVLPILEKYNARATVFIIGSYVEQDGYLTWDQIQEMAESGHFDFGSHSYNLHDKFDEGKNKGKTWMSAKLEGETDEEYYEKIKNDLIWNNNIIYERSSVFPSAISYPGAMANDIVIQAASDAGLKIGFIGANKTASKLENVNRFEIKRFHVRPETNIKNLIRFLHN